MDFKDILLSTNLIISEFELISQDVDKALTKLYKLKQDLEQEGKPASH